MNIFILGGIEGNTGPTNVNKELMQAWTAGDEVRTNKGSGLRRLTSGLLGVLWADCVVASGGGNTTAIPILAVRAMRKPYITVAHGYPPYENAINGLGYSKLDMGVYSSNLRHSTFIVGVSRMQMEFMASRMRGVRSKMRYFVNGIARREVAASKGRRREAVIAVSGGTRPIKNNPVVLQAVERLNGEGFPCSLRVYGRSYAGKGRDFLEAVNASQYAQMIGQVDSERFLADMTEVSVFVQNSLHEPFGLSAVEALQAGCSILVSSRCGVCEVLDLREQDMVCDPCDVDEVAEKIKNLVKCPNASRIAGGIDYERHSWEAAAVRLSALCKEAVALR